MAMTPANPDDARYTITELADLAGVTPRTVRYYLAQGLLPSVGVTGPGAKYDDTHLARLRLIRRLQHEHLPLAEIRRRLETLDDATILALTETAPEPPADSALDYIQRVTAMPVRPGRPAAALRMMAIPDLDRTAATAPPAATEAPPALVRSSPGVPIRDLPTEVSPQPRRAQWERVTLAPDIELHIRRPLTRSTAKRVDRLIEIARDLLEEDPS